jgi:hypothetical protein
MAQRPVEDDDAAQRTRRQRGAWYTPDALHRQLFAGLEPALARSRATVLDPACGDGALLVSAGEALLRAHPCTAADEAAARRTIVRDQLHGWDVTPSAIEAASTRLRAWAGLPPNAPLPNLEVRDALAAPAGAHRFDVVVGNPPYLSARARLTAPDAARRAALDQRWPGLRLATTDAAALFVALTLEVLAPEGRAALILPQSFLAAEGAGAVRAYAAGAASWIGAVAVPGTPFEDAAVEVVILTWSREACPPPLRIVGTGGRIHTPMQRPSGRRTWSPAIAAASGWPTPALRETTGRLADLARVTADFRDQFYGLVPHVIDLDASQSLGADWLPLAVSGAIDAAILRWGERPIRYAGRILHRPAVRAETLRTDAKLAAWAAARLVPKVIVATQGRVLEAFADTTGDVVPAVPTLSITPNPDVDLFHLLAVVLAPATSAWLGAQVWGAGLSSSAIKASAKQLATLPLPTTATAWHEGAARLRRAQGASDGKGRNEELRTFAHVMDDAYGLTGEARCAAWWCGRAVRGA